MARAKSDGKAPNICAKVLSRRALETADVLVSHERVNKWRQRHTQRHASGRRQMCSSTVRGVVLHRWLDKVVAITSVAESTPSGGMARWLRTPTLVGAAVMALRGVWRRWFFGTKLLLYWWHGLVGLVCWGKGQGARGKGRKHLGEARRQRTPSGVCRGLKGENHHVTGSETHKEYQMGWWHGVVVLVCWEESQKASSGGGKLVHV